MAREIAIWFLVIGCLAIPLWFFWHWCAFVTVFCFIAGYIANEMY